MFGLHVWSTCPSAARQLIETLSLPAPQYPLCLSLLEHKRVDVKPMITHRFAFDKDGVADGFDCAARSAQTKAIKVTCTPGRCIPLTITMQ